MNQGWRKPLYRGIQGGYRLFVYPTGSLYKTHKVTAVKYNVAPSARGYSELLGATRSILRVYSEYTPSILRVYSEYTRSYSCDTSNSEYTPSILRVYSEYTPSSLAPMERHYTCTKPEDRSTSTFHCIALVSTVHKSFKVVQPGKHRAPPNMKSEVPSDTKPW